MDVVFTLNEVDDEERIMNVMRIHMDDALISQIGGLPLYRAVESEEGGLLRDVTPLMVRAVFKALDREDRKTWTSTPEKSSRSSDQPVSGDDSSTAPDALSVT